MRHPWVRILIWLLSWSLLEAKSLAFDSLDDLEMENLSLEILDLESTFTNHKLAERQDTNITLNPPPSQDPWYQPPDGWETKAPGTVLKIRPNAFTPFNINNSIYTFQILYSTQDTHGNASWAVSTTFIPETALNCTELNDTDVCAHGIVTYLLPYDSADVDASPSYQLQGGEPYGEIADLLLRNWFVLVPDYEGPQASYCAGRQSGHATLDAVRTGLKVSPLFGLRQNESKAAIWGYSGGAFAAAFSAELAADYAPDLTLAGITLGGTAPNLTTVTQAMNKQDTAGLFVAGLVGITSQYPAAREFMLSCMHDEGTFNTSGFLSAVNMSGVEVLEAFAYQNVYDYFANGSIDLANPAILDVFNEDGMLGYHGTPNMPVFLYKAVHDEMSPINETDWLVDVYCQGGANILYERNSVGTHNVELWTARLRVFEFLHTVLDGEDMLSPPVTGCQILNVTIPITSVFPNISTGVIELGPPSLHDGI